MRPQRNVCCLRLICCAVCYVTMRDGSRGRWIPWEGGALDAPQRVQGCREKINLLDNSMWRVLILLCCSDLPLHGDHNPPAHGKHTNRGHLACTLTDKCIMQSQLPAGHSNHDISLTIVWSVPQYPTIFTGAATWLAGWLAGCSGRCNDTGMGPLDL